ncbi:MAG: hypothetical protein RLZ55_1738 [Actinomycetota bacterium]
MALPSRLTGILHPEGGHALGAGSFEGWYVKLVSADAAQRWAVIPGIFRGAGGAAADEAFVQVLDGGTGRSWYHRYDPAEFSARPDRLDVRVGPNHFTADGITLDLPGLRGRVQITSALDPWPVRLWSPGVMGWYAWVPSMECYHGICSFGHDLAGSLEIDGVPTSFDGGRGYIEKDWGEAFPAGYLWLHSNTFAGSDASLMASVALIPWRGREFRGFIVGLRVAEQLYRFATYNGSRSVRLAVDDERVEWTLATRPLPGRPPLQLQLSAERVAGGLLHAPIRTEMHKRVEETLDATVGVRLARGGEVLFEGEGIAAGLEVHGDTDRLLLTSEQR